MQDSTEGAGFQTGRTQSGSLPRAGQSRSGVPMLIDHAAEALRHVRARGPKVHCITNHVAQTFSANALLALGATPSMTAAAGEVASFAATADALLVNLGTLDDDRRRAIKVAVEVADGRGRPWVLDPVFVDRSPQRATFARDLLAEQPRALRLNAAEVEAMFGEESGETLGAYASPFRVLALTGQTDRITDGARLATIHNGHPLMERVTAMGCAASAILAAFLAIEADAWRASAAALLTVALAGEIAGENARGPGSFVPAFLDALYTLDIERERDRVRME